MASEFRRNAHRFNDPVKFCPIIAMATLFVIAIWAGLFIHAGWVMLGIVWLCIAGIAGIALGVVIPRDEQ